MFSICPAACLRGISVRYTWLGFTTDPSSATGSSGSPAEAGKLRCAGPAPRAQVRIVPGAEDPGNRRRRLDAERRARSEACAVLRLNAGRGGGEREQFRFAPWLTTLHGTVVGEGGLLLAKQQYSRAALGGCRNPGHPVYFIVSLLEPPVKTAGRAYVEFEVAGLGDYEDMYSIQFGVMSEDAPPEGWMAEAPGQHLVGSESRDDVVCPSPCAPRQPGKGPSGAGRPGDWFVGDRVGLLVDSGRMQVFINNGLIARPIRDYSSGRLKHTPDRSPAGAVFAEGLLSTVRFAVRFRGRGSGHAVRIVDRAPYPGDGLAARPPQPASGEGGGAAAAAPHPPGTQQGSAGGAAGGAECSSSEWETEEDWDSRSPAEGSSSGHAGAEDSDSGGSTGPAGFPGPVVVTNSVARGWDPCHDPLSKQRAELAAMGFSRAAVETALAFNGGDVPASVGWLLDPANLYWLGVTGALGVSPRLAASCPLVGC